MHMMKMTMWAARMLPILWVMWMGVLFPDTAEAAAEKAAIQKVMPSVVEIHVFDDNNRRTGAGSGFIVGRNGLIATNYHVIRDAASARVILPNGDASRVRGVRDFDIERDFAILQIEATELPAVQFANSDQLEPGDPLLAIGAPLGLSRTVSQGIVSQIRPLEGFRLIQHTAAISPGSSGGPLLNLAGQVAGINTSLIERGQSLYFALPINYLRDALAHLPPTSTPLRELAEARRIIEQKQQEAALVKAIDENFFLYQDPDDLFRLLLPKGWRVERSVTQNREGATTVTFMASAPGAEQARLNGWLSAGIRIRIVLPPSGRTWKEAMQREWAKDTLLAIARGYKKFENGEPQEIEFAGTPAAILTFLGVSDKLSEPELAHLIIAPSAYHLVTVEVALPASERDALEALSIILLKTFEWIP